jgi:hypothetical protein
LVGRIWKSELVVTEGRKNGRKVEYVIVIDMSVVKVVPAFLI